MTGISFGRLQLGVKNGRESALIELGKKTMPEKFSAYSPHADPKSSPQWCFEVVIEMQLRLVQDTGEQLETGWTRVDVLCLSVMRI